MSIAKAPCLDLLPRFLNLGDYHFEYASINRDFFAFPLPTSSYIFCRHWSMSSIEYSTAVREPGSRSKSLLGWRIFFSWYHLPIQKSGCSVGVVSNRSVSGAHHASIVTPFALLMMTLKCCLQEM